MVQIGKANRSVLPLLARLQSLQDPVQPGPDGARQIADGSAPDPLGALLREVNETVLARALTFASANGSGLTLEVAGRRVLRLAAATGLQGAEGCLAAPALDDEHKDALIKLLQAVAAKGQALTVTVSPILREMDGVSVGLPVALLADLCLVDLNPMRGKGPEVEPQAVSEAAEAEPEAAAPAQVDDDQEFGFLARLARESGPAMIAWLIRGGLNDGLSDGPEEMVAHLLGFLDDEADALTRQLDMVTMVPAGPVCLVLGASLVEGHSILCGRSGDSMLLGVVEGDATQVLLRAWNRASA